MKLNEITERLNFDTRLIEFNFKHKVITRTDYQDHLKKLEDVSSNVDHVQLDETNISSQ